MMAQRLGGKENNFAAMAEGFDNPKFALANLVIFYQMRYGYNEPQAKTAIRRDMRQMSVWIGS